MKLLKGELYDNVWDDVDDKGLEHAPYGSPVRHQTTKNFGWWNDNNLIMLKIRDSRWHIISDLDETD